MTPLYKAGLRIEIVDINSSMTAITSSYLMPCILAANSLLFSLLTATRCVGELAYEYAASFTQPLTWAQYSRLMVDFIMVNAPDQSDRREAKAEAAQAAADKEKPKKRARKGG